MKLVVVAVGQRMPTWVDAGFEEYARRMPREAPVTLTEVKAEARGEKQASAELERLLEAEARRITAALPKNAYKVLLDEHGSVLSTVELSERIKGWQMEGRDLAFVIGGADGLSPRMKREADLVWSLSRLTLPHGLVRVVLAEQLYRAVSIVKSHPYHRA
jgi:23S rRNA (pseudouridine1915-N3)-methyltransferase